MLLLVVWAAITAAGAPLEGFKVNEQKLKLKIVESSAQSATYISDELEVRVRSVKLPNEAVAKQKAERELANLQNLYKPRGNPYVGQVSELVECGKELLPKTQTIDVRGTPVSLLVGGVSERKLFGACAKDEVAYWGGYFQVFYGPANAAMEVRMFLKRQDAKSLALGQAKLAQFAKELFE